MTVVQQREPVAPCGYRQTTRTYRVLRYHSKILWNVIAVLYGTKTQIRVMKLYCMHQKVIMRRFRKTDKKKRANPGSRRDITVYLKLKCKPTVWSRGHTRACFLLPENHKYYYNSNDRFAQYRKIFCVRKFGYNKYLDFWLVVRKIS